MNLQVNKNWVSQQSSKNKKRVATKKSKLIKEITNKLKAICVFQELSKYNWEYIGYLIEDNPVEFVDTCVLILENINKARGDVKMNDVKRMLIDMGVE